MHENNALYSKLSLLHFQNHKEYKLDALCWILDQLEHSLPNFEFNTRINLQAGLTKYMEC